MQTLHSKLKNFEIRLEPLMKRLPVFRTTRHRGKAATTTKQRRHDIHLGLSASQSTNLSKSTRGPDTMFSQLNYRKYLARQIGYVSALCINQSKLSQPVLNI
ncbi:hypothetical protein RRG08_055414 [Elysia crispata]|uniref:Uncharacterized protein n=1 Tax=Elysia crispata TaxID=231223 RepID=A0AAE1E316_9GAST|nr:hypothetical protein RRG08_055414 [Elysia crispata]